MSKITMICGLPCSGKSTFAESFIQKGLFSLNQDSENGNLNSLLPKLEVLLQDRKDVILDDNFPTVASRQPFIEMAKKYDAFITCALLDTSMEDAQFNAVERAIRLTGKFPTPEVIKETNHPHIFGPEILFAYQTQFEAPTINEGFYRVDHFHFERKNDPTFVNKALIVDFDGTIRECIGGNAKFPTLKEHVQIKENRAAKLKEYKDKDYILLGISNQSGIYKGELTEHMAIELFNHTNSELGVDIEYDFCPHQSEPISCYCRKPHAGLFVKFMMKYKLDRKNCIFVGDYHTDKLMAENAGIQYYDQVDFFR